MSSLSTRPLLSPSTGVLLGRAVRGGEVEARELARVGLGVRVVHAAPVLEERLVDRRARSGDGDPRAPHRVHVLQPSTEAQYARCAVHRVEAVSERRCKRCRSYRIALIGAEPLREGNDFKSLVLKNCSHF